jgi:carotenoid cleavage dioxygenase-like enzyme
MPQEMATKAARTNLAPIPFECDAPFLKVVGELPRELNGTLYRNGPNPQFEASGAHWFVGDGMLHAFQLENGRASYRNRWVRTPKWQAEHDAGRAFVRRLRPQAAGCAANDHPGQRRCQHQHHLSRRPPARAGGRPSADRDRARLAHRRGYCNYGGGIAGPFTARPKIDPTTGEMVFFGYNAAGPLTPALSFGSVNASGVVTRFDRFEAPYASMVHDFIVTEHHLMFPILPRLDQSARRGLCDPVRGARPLSHAGRFRLEQSSR